MSAAPKPSMLAVMAKHMEQIARRLVAVETTQPAIADLERRIRALETKASDR